MDENKEVLTTQAEEAAQEAAAETGEAVEAAEDAAEEKAAELEVVEEDDAEASSENEDAAPAKKPFPLQKTVIIALVIVALTAIIALVITVFFNKGVTGEWRFDPTENAAATADEATKDESQPELAYYFKFNNDGTVSLSLGSTTNYGTYTLSKNEDGKQIMSLSLTNLSGDFYYETSGNLLTGRSLKLTYTADETSVLNLHSGKQVKPEIKREGEFKPKKELTGNWVYSDQMYGYTISFDIREDGTLLYTEDSSYTNPYTMAEVYSVYTIDGIYEYDDSTITFKYYDITDREVVIVYELKDGGLMINGNVFTRDGVATADSAK